MVEALDECKKAYRETQRSKGDTEWGRFYCWQFLGALNCLSQHTHTTEVAYQLVMLAKEWYKGSKEQRYQTIPKSSGCDGGATDEEGVNRVGFE